MNGQNPYNPNKYSLSQGMSFGTPTTGSPEAMAAQQGQNNLSSMLSGLGAVGQAKDPISGAAAGAAAGAPGGVWGAGIGAGVGALSGILQARSQRKASARQAQAQAMRNIADINQSVAVETNAALSNIIEGFRSSMIRR